jgi:hypothetical protein
MEIATPVCNYPKLEISKEIGDCSFVAEHGEPE